MAYMENMETETGFLRPSSVRDKGKELAEIYQKGDPFPSIVIEDFLPTNLAEKLLENFSPEFRHDDLNKIHDRDQERFKASYHPDTLNNYARGIFYAFNSRPFIRVIENITGIKGLIPDPYYSGAGFHEIQTGGHLSIHADFNHHKMLNLERRVNILIYLNKDWREEYGGQLELWTSDMSRQAKTFIPTFNRCVIFNTTSDSMHGNPQKVCAPNGRTRKSIALYYYTSTWNALKKSHTTQFQVRPSTDDKIDWRLKIRELKKDMLPPFLIRYMGRIRRMIQRHAD
jgi:Rps23 Pro-64 3,4-dihydroxylase Tpa1-like proline 4-hydroxylase